MKSTVFAAILGVVYIVTMVTALHEPIPPPPHKDLVGNARWMVKFSNVSILATHSSFLDGYPFAQNKDVADGHFMEALSSGVPYIYASGMATIAKDFMKDPRVTMSYSAEFTHWCQDQGLDNDDPRCGKVMLSGEMEALTDSNEITWAKYGMFSRHPNTAHWPPSHGFTFYKLNIKNIFTLDYFGGATKHLNVTEYLDYKFQF